MSRRRVRAVVRKELREYARNRYMLVTMGVIPLIFLLEPLISILRLPATAAVPVNHRDQLLYLLAIPALVPAIAAAAAVVTERQQGTLEPVLTTPLRTDELVLAKALAPLLPSIAVAYAVYGLFVAAVVLFADAGVASTLFPAEVILAQVVFTPLIAAWSIWVGLAISTLASDIRVAQQLSVLGNLPVVAVTTLIAFNVIHPSLRLALALGVVLLVGFRVGWHVVSALFDRERMVTTAT